MNKTMTATEIKAAIQGARVGDAPVLQAIRVGQSIMIPAEGLQGMGVWVTSEEVTHLALKSLARVMNACSKQRAMEAGLLPRGKGYAPSLMGGATAVSIHARAETMPTPNTPNAPSPEV